MANAWAIGMACALAACVDRSPVSAERAEDDGICVVAEAPRSLRDLPEASGVTLSRRTPGLLWAHNDSGPPVLHALDASGAARGQVRIPNASVDDWEDITTGPCPGGSCLYIADIGDNNRLRRRVTIYRLPEPQPGDGQSAAAETFTARYPDGPHDAEGLFISGDELFIVTKDSTAGVYRFPQPLDAGAEMTLERVAELPLRRVTGADVSADGAWVVARTGDEAVFYRAADLAGGTPRGISVSLRELDEPQGEGVALDAGGMLYLVSEGGGGRFAAMRCTLPPP
jgi:hypothetical protein